MTLLELEKLLELLMRGRSSERAKLKQEVESKEPNPTTENYLKDSIDQFNVMIDRVMEDIHSIYSAV